MATTKKTTARRKLTFRGPVWTAHIANLLGGWYVSPIPTRLLKSRRPVGGKCYGYRSYKGAAELAERIAAIQPKRKARKARR